MSCALYMEFCWAVSGTFSSENYLVAEEKRRIMSELRKKKPQESSMWKESLLDSGIVGRVEK